MSRREKVKAFIWTRIEYVMTTLRRGLKIHARPSMNAKEIRKTRRIMLMPGAQREIHWNMFVLSAADYQRFQVTRRTRDDSNEGRELGEITVKLSTFLPVAAKPLVRYLAPV